MNNIDTALALIKKYGEEKFSSKLADSDYITRKVRKTFGYKTELLYISNEYANQVIGRMDLCSNLNQASKKYKNHSCLFHSLADEIDRVYSKKFDDGMFDTFCKELLIYMKSSVLNENNPDLTPEQIKHIEFFRTEINNFSIKQKGENYEQNL